jgi:hypothetical protein
MLACGWFHVEHRGLGLELLFHVEHPTGFCPHGLPGRKRTAADFSVEFAEHQEAFVAPRQPQTPTGGHLTLKDFGVLFSDQESD